MLLTFQKPVSVHFVVTNAWCFGGEDIKTVAAG